MFVDDPIPDEGCDPSDESLWGKSMLTGLDATPDPEPSLAPTAVVPMADVVWVHLTRDRPTRCLLLGEVEKVLDPFRITTPGPQLGVDCRPRRNKAA